MKFQTFIGKKIFLTYLFKSLIVCTRTLELLLGGSNECPQSLFWIKNKNIYIRVYMYMHVPLYTLILLLFNWGSMEVLSFHGHDFSDDSIRL